MPDIGQRCRFAIGTGLRLRQSTEILLVDIAMRRAHFALGRRRQAMSLGDR